MTVAAISLVILGCAMAMAHLALLVPAALRPDGVAGRQDAAGRHAASGPEIFGWGYIVVGLLVSLAAYASGRVLGGGTLAASDAIGLMLLLSVASWGFGSAHLRLQSPGRRDLPWFTPFVASLLLGLTLGLSSFQPS